MGTRCSDAQSRLISRAHWSKLRRISGATYTKQHLRIKRFHETSEIAAKTQIWIAISAYVLAGIGKWRLPLTASLGTLMQV
jgi:hypothetical protein